MFISKKAKWPVSRSIRIALALGVPLLVGVLLKQPAWGLVIAVGGLIPSMAEKEIPYPRRLTQMLVLVPFGLLGFFATSFLPQQFVVMVVVYGLLGLLAGILSSHGARLSAAAMMMLVFASLAPHMAKMHMTWQFVAGMPIGAAWSALLLCVEWAIRRHGPERALMAAYLEAVGRRALAGAALTAGQTLPGREDVAAARDAAYRELLRLRKMSDGRAQYEELTARRLAAISDLGLAVVSEATSPHDSQQALKQVGDWLLAAGATWRRGDLPPPPEVADGTLAQRADRIQRALAGDPIGPPVELEHHRSTNWAERFRDTLPGRAVLGAAGRLALCMAVAAAAMVLIPGRSYWIPLTVAIVLKPDFGSIFARAVLRTLGTSAGVLIGLLILALVPKGIWMIPVIALLAACMPWASARNYALMAVFMTPFIVVLLDFATPGHTVNFGWERLLDTAIGGAIVLLLGYLPWRSSRHTDVGGTFADVLTDIVDYQQAAFRRTDDEASARRKAFSELSDLSIQLQRSLSEPPPANSRAAAWFPVAASAERVMDLVTGAVNNDAVPAPAGRANRLRAIAESVAAKPTMLPATPEAPPDEPRPATDLSEWYGRELDVEIRHMERLLQPATGPSAAAAEGAS